MIDVPASPFQLHAGPGGVTIDTTRLAEEASGLGIVLVFLVLLRFAFKMIGRL